MKDTTTNTSKEPNVQSVSRAIQIIKCFKQQPSLNLTDIGNLVGLHKSTAYGIITTLKNEGFLEKDESTGNYRLGHELFDLAACYEINIRKVAAPYITELSNLTQETVNLVIPDDNCVVYVDKCESKHPMRISTRIGTKLPMYCTAVGKCILASYNNKDIVSQILDRTQLIQCTPNTHTRKDVIMQELEEIRKQGYAIDDEELEPGLRCIAAPILNSIGHPVAAISCSAPIIRMNKSMMNQYIYEVKDIANRISHELYSVNITL